MLKFGRFDGCPQWAIHGKPINRKGHLLPILIAEPEDQIRTILSGISEFQLDLIVATSVSEAVGLIEQCKPHIAIIDGALGASSGVALIDVLRESSPETLIVFVAHPSETAVGYPAQARAASIVLEKPFQSCSLINTLRYLLRRHFHEPRVQPESGLIGISPQLDHIKRLLPAIARSSHPVLLLGETGTGKDLLARLLHLANTSRKGPFVTVDCGSLSPSLIENELFGHAKGAYTGADSSCRGLVQEADGGTLFLDEIGELPLESQTRLLRLLQERQCRPVGSLSTLRVDIRVIAATNVDLEGAVNDHRFREDLYFRLNTFSLRLPSLRERRQDIPFLIDAFAALQGYRGPIVTIDGFFLLMRHCWPGNVRELQNTLIRAATLADRDLDNAPLKAVDIIESMPSLTQPQLADTTSDSGGGTYSASLDSLGACEKAHILRILESSNFDKVEAARRLGIGKTTLYRKLKQYASIAAFFSVLLCRYYVGTGLEPVRWTTTGSQSKSLPENRAL